MQFVKTYVLAVLFLLHIATIAQTTTGKATISGHVKDSSGVEMPGVIVMLEGTSFGSATSETGHYTIHHIPAGSYVLVTSTIGYQTQKRSVHLDEHQHLTINIEMKADSAQEEIHIEGKTEAEEIKRSAYTVDVIDATKYANTSSDLNQVLNHTSGVRIRESGGVGSTFNFSLNGFTGKQVKFFIDGVPMDNFGSSFQLNNIPINLAERIEVYKGVVPIWLGADAMGGAINVVTSTKQRTYADVSYSYGSFNTHRTSLNAGYIAKSGFTVQFNAFQNYSDNNYWVNVRNASIPGGNYSDVRVRRFNDNYHNETGIFNIGVVGKKFADRLLFGITLGQNKADIQTGAQADAVYGDLWRRGNIIMPSIKYQKKNLFIKGLDLNVTGNYNFGKEQNIDTVNRRYNWKQEFTANSAAGAPGGERGRTLYKYSNNTSIVTTNIIYQLNVKHSIMLNNVFSSFNRKGSNALDENNEANKQPKITQKSIIALGYKYDYNTRWSTSVFLKEYIQVTTISRAQEASGGWGTTEYVRYKNVFKATGYGFATTYFIYKTLQAKLSYEKGLRLPDNEELFGDLIQLEGNANLKPEISNNINVGLSYNKVIQKNHFLLMEGYFIYRNLKDFIRPELNINQTYQVMKNQGSVKNTGINGEVRYSYKRKYNIGANLSYQNLINHVQYEENGTSSNKESIVYLDRIPNMPFLYGNADASVVFKKVGGQKNSLSIGYNLTYVHFYYLKWPSQGSKDNKFDIPMQLSHDINMVYTMRDGRYNIALECRNIGDANLYDNFRLPKPGRAFYIKVRYFISK
jgi:outer membrane receptor protein involved in Fe transport